MDSFVNETADAFANLATATASDRQMLADLTTANKDLTAHLAKQDNEIKQLRAKIHTLQTKDRTGRNAGRNAVTSARKFNNNNYCWTHGFDISKNHTSKTCLFPAEGHEREAVKCNIMRGSVAN